jgi:hypothetical protein
VEGSGACPLSNTGHVNAQQQNAALCQQPKYAAQQTAAYSITSSARRMPINACQLSLNGVKLNLDSRRDDAA